MADRTCVFKQCLKELAEAAGMSVTFMAKFAADRRGSSCHIHLSLWRDGATLSRDDRARTGAAREFAFPRRLARARPRADGVLRADGQLLQALRRRSWAPTRLAWSYDNRTAGFRVVGEGQSLRIECRIPGADCNAYLALAAALASAWTASRTASSRPNASSAMSTPPSAAARALHPFPGGGRVRSERIRQARLRQGRGRALHATSIARRRRPFDKAVTDWSAGDTSSGRPPKTGTQKQEDTFFCFDQRTYEAERQVALITGAGSGIGRQSALLFAKEGADCLWQWTSTTAPLRKRCNS
jgi:glutamine synthetase